MKHWQWYFKTHDGLKLFAQGWKPLEPVKAVLALVHGLGEHGGRYEALAQALVSQGYAVVAFDQRGFGRSEGRRGYVPGYDYLLADLDVFLDQVRELFSHKPLFLCGHSMGGNLVLNYGLERKKNLAGIMATGPWLRLAFTLPRWKMFLAKVLDKVWPSFTQSHGLRTAADFIEETNAPPPDPLVHDRISARLFMEMERGGQRALHKASQFKYPLLLMHGQADAITSPKASEDFAGKVGDKCTFKLWPGLYHNLLQEPVLPQVVDFLLLWLEERLEAGEKK